MDVGIKMSFPSKDLQCQLPALRLLLIFVDCHLTHFEMTFIAVIVSEA